MTDRIGQQLGNYCLLQLLGRGGFAEVYLGRHIHLDTLAAVKVLHTQLSRDDSEQFHTEARTIAHLAHPHIVRILDYGIDNDTPFLVMDYAPNGTLHQQHPRGTLLPPTLVARYVTQIAAALQYAHEQGIIHRDVKPENMLVDRQKEILLSDFGIALAAQNSRYRSVHEMAGTISYMAPEQIQFHPCPASDQYALGITVYEWLSGERPFHGTFFEVASQHMLAAPPPLHNRVPGLSSALEEVLFTALAKDPARRFPSVQAFAQAFAQLYTGRSAVSLPEPPILPSAPSASSSLQAGSTVYVTRPAGPVGRTEYATAEQYNARISSFRPSTPERAQIDTPPALPLRGLDRFQAKHLSRRTILAGITGLVALGSVGTWFATTRKDAPAWPSFTNAQPSPAPAHVLGAHRFTFSGHSDIVSSLSWSQDGRRMASGSFDTTVQIWDATTGNNLLVYQGHANKVTTVAYSYDGVHLASGGVDATVQVWDAATGAHLLTYDAHNYPMRTLAWSTRPINNFIASAGSDNEVHVWEIATRATRSIYKGHTQAINQVSWSTDGSHIASASADATVQVWNPTTGEREVNYRGHKQEVRTVQWTPDGTFIASGGQDGVVHVWNSSTGELALAYKGHTAPINQLSWSPDGKYVASASDDGTIHAWNAFTGARLLMYRGHASSVLAVAWSPDNNSIASGGTDTTVQVW